MSRNDIEMARINEPRRSVPCKPCSGQIVAQELTHFRYRVKSALGGCRPSRQRRCVSRIVEVVGMESESRSEKGLVISDSCPASPTLSPRESSVCSFRPSPATVVAAMKARQASKIKALGDALVTAGFVTLDEQAEALDLPRSTTWTILKANHKASGLSATIINRMLAAPQLPTLARAKLLEYIREKSAGLYGGSRCQLRRFASRVSIDRPGSRESAAKRT